VLEMRVWRRRKSEEGRGGKGSRGRGQAVEGGAQAAGCRVRQPDAGQVAGRGQAVALCGADCGGLRLAARRARGLGFPGSRSEEHQRDAVFRPPKAAGDKELPGRRAGA
jgi:hypothetical protein